MALLRGLSRLPSPLSGGRGKYEPLITPKKKQLNRTMPESEQTVVVDNRVREIAIPNWVKWITTIGLGGVIGYQAFQHFMGADEKTDEFMQTTLITTMNANTAASTSLKETSIRVEAVLGKVEDELDDFTKATIEQNKRIDRLIERQWQSVGEQPE